MGVSGEAIMDRTELAQLNLHQFDFAASLDSAIRTYMATTALGNLADAGGRVVGGAATFVMTAGSIGLNIWQEHDNVMAARQSIQVMGDNSRLDNVLFALGIETVIVTNITGTTFAPQYDFNAIPFPTIHTPGGVDVFMSAYMADRHPGSNNLEQPAVAEFLADFDRYFAWYNTRNYYIRGAIRDQAAESRSANNWPDIIPATNNTPDIKNSIPEELLH